MEWLIGALGGLIGGNAAGAKNSLGVAGNSVAGAVGGGLTGLVLQQVMGGGGIDFAQIAGQLGGGGVVGAVLAAVVGALTKGRKQ